MIVSFVIPFHNEEKNCTSMVEKVVYFARKKGYRFEVIPVDDKSTDTTGKLLEAAAKKYQEIHPVYRKNKSEEKGNTMGKALIDGTRKAKGEIIIWTMGDMADDVNTYETIIRELEKGADLVFGSRYMPGGSRGNLDPIKAFLSSWGTLLARILFSVPVHDITNAFRGFKKEIFEKITLTSSGFSISPELAIKAYLAGYKLAEVPTVYTNRVEGISSFKLFRMTRNYLELYWCLFWKYKILGRELDFVK